MATIETPRFLLRPFTTDDWRDFQALALDWAAAPGPAFDKWPTGEEACRASVGYLAGRGEYRALCDRASGRVVGLLADNGPEADGRHDLGHVILSSYQDGDRDREALAAMVAHLFATTNAAALVTRNDPDHTAQMAPLLALGFTHREPAERGELVLAREEWSRSRAGAGGE